MILINKQSSDLLRGYQRLSRAESELGTHWRPRLLAAYARRREAYEIKLQEYVQHRRILGLGSWGGTAVAGLTVFSAVLLPVLPFFMRFMLIGMSVLIGLFLVLFWTQIVETAKPNPPAHPLQGPYHTLMQRPLLLDWLTMINSHPYWPDPKPGHYGEELFINMMCQYRDRRCYMLHNLQLRPGDDIDLLIIGAKGIWLFEVKYWKGLIFCREDAWYQQKRDQDSLTPLNQSPIKQWSRMVTDLQDTLRRCFPDKSPEMLTVGGGVVFSYDGARYDIGACCQGHWGTMQDWAGRFARASDTPRLSENETFQLIDALLQRHQTIAAPNEPVYSMYGAAQQLVQETEAVFAGWMTSPGK